jgi:RNA polymerase sigma factor (sigma-70 family)
MAAGQMSSVIRHLRRAALLQEGAGMTDGQLLDCFLARREEAAFEALLRRHGPMVLAVCRRVLKNPHDAEDAFQATFLVLVRKLASFQPRQTLGGWLYGVAYHTALKARAATGKRRAKEARLRNLPTPAQPRENSWEELRPLLDQELNRLPDLYREAVVLCDLEGKTRREAARQLGLPEGTLSGRLTTARRLLARRLARRGLALAGGALTTILSQNVATAGVPAPLVIATVKAAASVAAGRAAAAAVSAPIAAAMKGMTKTMLLTKLQSSTVVLLILAALGIGVGVAYQHSHAQGPSPGTREGRAETPAPEPAARPQPMETWKTVATLAGHQDPVQCLVFGPNNVLLTGGKEGHFKVWDANTGKETAGFKNDTGSPKGLTFAPDGTWVAFRFDDGIALSFDKSMKDGRPIHIGPGIGLGDFVPLALAPDGKTYAWRKANTPVVDVFDLDLTQKVVGEKTNHVSCEGHTDEPLCAAFSPNGDLLASGSGDKTARLWDAFTGKAKGTLTGHTGAIVVVEFAPDSKLLATGGKDGTVKLWEVATGKEKATLKGHDVVRCLAFSPDGKTLASGGDDQTIKVWDVAKGGNERTTLKGHTNSVHCLSFNRDGTILASAGLDRTVKLWQPDK